MIPHLLPVTFDVVEGRLYDLREINVQHVRTDAHDRSVLFVKLLVYQMDVATRSVPSSPQVRVLSMIISHQRQVDWTVEARGTLTG